ncbi:hypothetical protein J2W56_006489 [Nocardia kruczakiae]|uniref:DUF3093 family protein n=1 Tax=Nocardia kruczakiae TaxID=261477 RepID=A0ABU1XQ78_9NOCA|nr:hypothetical protein [Nocardia kruczakiae]
MSDAQPTAAVRPDSVLFSEPGARWRTVAYGPLLCLLVLILELALRRGPVHWFGLTFCAILLAGFVTLQVVAGKRHVSVELTDSALREGTETLPLESIARVFPEHDEESWDDDPWESARALGELTGVPRRRRGIGLKLRDGAMVQAWARDHQQLRAELSAALERLAEESAPAAKDSADSPAKESAAVLAASADDAENSVVASGSDSQGDVGSEGKEDVA